MEKQTKEECIICSGKYSVEAVAMVCTTEPVCMKHIEEITKHLLNKKKMQDKEKLNRK